MKETKTVLLPSRGKFYTNQNLADGYVEISYMTAIHEDILSESSTDIKFKSKKFLNDIIVTPDVSVDDILLCDIDAIFLASKIINFGSKFDGEVMCPKCGEKFQTQLNLTDIKSKDIEDFNFECDGFELKPLTFKQSLDCENQSDILKCVIQHEDTDKIVENMRSIQSLKIRKYMKENFPSMDFSNLSIECPSCGYTFSLNLPLDLSIFGLTPTYKVALHKEIFSLCYYSEGAFNQDIVYNLPIYLRRFYLNELKLAKEEEKKQMDKSSNSQSSAPPIARPNIPKG